MGDELIVYGLSRLEALELQRGLRAGSETARIATSEALGSGQLGDAAVMNLITQATPWAMGVLALWLMKPRTMELVTRKLSCKDEHGQIHEETIRTSKYTESALETKVVQILAKLFGLHVDNVNAAVDLVKNQATTH